MAMKIDNDGDIVDNVRDDDDDVDHGSDKGGSALRRLEQLGGHIDGLRSHSSTHPFGCQCGQIFCLRIVHLRCKIDLTI